MKRRLFFLLILLFPHALLAQSMHVISSIKPIALLLSSLSQGEFNAQPLLKTGASPHDYALKPSDMKRINSADLIIWAGASLEPFLLKPLATHTQLALLTSPELKPLLQAAGTKHHTHAAHHHAHSIDPHFWLGIEQSRAAARSITKQLILLDPSSKQKRQNHLQAFEAKLDLTAHAIKKQLMPVQNRGYFVFHDAYGYFEQYFSLRHLGAFTLNPQQKPGAKQLFEIKQQLMSEQAVCVFSEPQFRPAIVTSILKDTPAKQGTLDPLATDIKLDKQGYWLFLEQMAFNFETCLKL